MSPSIASASLVAAAGGGGGGGNHSGTPATGGNASLTTSGGDGTYNPGSGGSDGNGGGSIASGGGGGAGYLTNGATIPGAIGAGGSTGPSYAGGVSGSGAGGFGGGGAGGALGAGGGGGYSGGGGGGVGADNAEGGGGGGGSYTAPSFSVATESATVTGDGSITLTLGGTTYTFSETGAPAFFEIPTTGLYTITIEGAQGGSSSRSGTGGDGAMITGTDLLAAGTDLELFVGEEGASGGNLTSGGGGGSFLIDVPEPASLALLGFGLAGTAVTRRDRWTRRNSARASC